MTNQLSKYIGHPSGGFTSRKAIYNRIKNSYIQHNRIVIAYADLRPD